MTQKRVKASDVIGNSYYIYTLESSNNTPALNGTINITCNVTNVYGQAVSGKSITLYQNSTSKGAKTTDSNGNASWNSISMGSAGLQTFKVENSKIEVFVDNKSDVGHTHSQYLTEHQSLSNYVTTDDSRLSDSRTPTSHAHGNLQNNGQVGSTAQANKNVVTNSSGLITTEDKPTIPSASSTTPSADTTNGSVGTGTTWARSNHAHPKSNLYAEATHNHTKSQITDFPSIPSKTSDLQNDSGFLTSHQSLSGYLQTSDVKDNLTSTDTDKPLSAYQGKELKTLIDSKEDNIEIFTGSVDRVNSTSAYLKAYTTSSSIESKIILYEVPNISSIEQATNVALDYYMNNQTVSFYRKYIYKNGVQLTFGDIESNSWILLAYDGTLTNGQWNLISSSSYAEANHTHSNYLTSHQDITGKEDSSNKVSSWNSTTNNIRYPTEKLVKDSLDGKADNGHTHTIDLNSFDFYDADNWRTLEGNAPIISSNSIQANAVSSHILNKEFLESKYYTLTFEFNTASSRNGLYLFGDMECNRKFGIVTDVGNTFVEQYDINGNATRLYDGTKNHFTNGWHDIKVIRKGATATLYIDDELYYTFNNIGSCTNILGLWKWSMNSVTIRNVDVSLDVTELPVDDYVGSDDILDLVYPVGSIYMSVNSTSPATLFGGTWEQIKDMFLLASGDTYANGSTGGSSTVALTKAQMPRHNHTQAQHRHTEHGNWSTGSGSSSGYMYTSSRAVSTQYTDYATPTINHTGGTGSTNADANGSPHENMPPYLAVYMWKRIA